MKVSLLLLGYLTVISRAQDMAKLPDVLTDDQGDEYKLVPKETKTGVDMQIYQKDRLILTVFNVEGLMIEIPEGRDVCIIRDPNAVGDCFEEVPYTDPVSDAVKEKCKGKQVVKQVPIDCGEQATATKEKRALDAQSPISLIRPWPRWSTCCRWIRYPCWPCRKPVCLSPYQRYCGYWGCYWWTWRWCWARICISGYEYPYFYPYKG